MKRYIVFPPQTVAVVEAYDLKQAKRRYGKPGSSFPAHTIDEPVFVPLRDNGPSEPIPGQVEIDDLTGSPLPW